MEKLRIAILGSNFIRIPPNPPEQYLPPGASGAPEIIIHHLTEELVERGHDVTLFASGDSQTKARLESVTDQATWLTVGKGPHLEYERLLISALYQKAQRDEFDIIHSHFDIQSAFFAPLVSTPTVQTLHSPLDGTIKSILSNYKETQYYISISNNQRLALPDLNYISTVYNGVDINNLPFSLEKGDYFVHIGRILPDKGAAEAIAVAKQTGSKLLLFGSVDPTSDYWTTKIKPMIDDKQIIYKGMIPQQELFQYIAKAKALLFSIQWEEPFGLAMIEAMACGTPVIAFHRGSVPEVVTHGKTGFIVETLEEMVLAVQRIDEINRQECRDHVEKTFSMKNMVDGYEQAYYSILEKTKKGLTR